MTRTGLGREPSPPVFRSWLELERTLRNLLSSLDHGAILRVHADGPLELQTSPRSRPLCLGTARLGPEAFRLTIWLSNLPPPFAWTSDRLTQLVRRSAASEP